MSERDVRRIEVLTEVLSGRWTVASAAVVLAITARQVNRLLIRFRENGGGGLIHKGRGKSSNHGLCDGVRGYVLELVKTKYADFGPTLASEVLIAKHDIQVGRETLRTWMLEEGFWLSRKQRRSFHQPRLRRESYGELIQIDGSDHRWFEPRGEPCTLLVFIDDATSKLMQLRFVPSESTDSYFAALEGYVNDHGCPVAFYSDKQTVFRVNKPDAKGGSGMTQFGRALAELNIEILCANSSQAKGRVERANRTLQDRLVKELRLADISDMSAGNAFLPGFMKHFNEKFSLPAVKAENLHRRLNVQAPRLADILCHREQRHVGQQLGVWVGAMGLPFVAVLSTGRGFGRAASSAVRIAVSYSAATPESFSSLGIKDGFADDLQKSPNKPEVTVIQVDVRRLDTILAQHYPQLSAVDMVAIDVEGWGRRRSDETRRSEFEIH